MKKDLFTTAYLITKTEFKDKTDKAGEPYLNHLWRVMKQVRGSERLEVIALLHDLLEDCPNWTADRLKEEFPLDIVLEVIRLTHLKGEDYEDYIKRVAESPTATAVKMADLMDNMNITRLNNLTDKDLLRLKKYHSAYKYLENESKNN